MSPCRPGKHHEILTLMNVQKKDGTKMTNLTRCPNIKFGRERMIIAMEMVIHKYVVGAADNTGADLIIFHMMTESEKFFIFYFKMAPC